MAKPIVFAAQARAEINAAAGRYGDERGELKVEFHAAVGDALGRSMSAWATDQPHLMKSTSYFTSASVQPASEALSGSCITSRTAPPFAAMMPSFVVLSSRE